jgi:hypothetical protein
MTRNDLRGRFLVAAQYFTRVVGCPAYANIENFSSILDNNRYQHEAIGKDEGRTK